MSIKFKDAQGLVRRARAGDQNAMALIAETRRSSLLPKGKEARKSLSLIMKAIKANPVSMGEVAFESDGSEVINCTGSEAVFLPRLGDTAATHLGVLKFVASGHPGDPEADAALLQIVGQCLFCLSHTGDPGADPVAIILLARGGPLSAPRLAHILDGAPSDDAKRAVGLALISGSQEPLANEPFTRVGHVLGRARALQLASNPTQPVSRWCLSMGGELDE